MKNTTGESLVAGGVKPPKSEEASRMYYKIDFVLRAGDTM